MRLLVVAPHYDSFIKGLVEAEPSLLDEVRVLVHHNFLAEIPSYLPFSGYLDWIRRFGKGSLLDPREVPEDVEVHVASTIHPPSRISRGLGDRLARIYEGLIKKIRYWVRPHMRSLHLALRLRCCEVGPRLRDPRRGYRA